MADVPSPPDAAQVRTVDPYRNPAFVETFLAAVRRLESGSHQGNYGVVTDVGKNGWKARGAYQIVDAWWDDWARQAGIPGADWRDPAAQDTVARFKMRQYFKEFGDWRLVAVAWFAGPGTARKLVAEGPDAVAGKKDKFGTTPLTYIEKIETYFPEALENGYTPKFDPSLLSRLDPEAELSVLSERNQWVQLAKEASVSDSGFEFTTSETFDSNEQIADWLDSLLQQESDAARRNRDLQQKYPSAYSIVGQYLRTMSDLVKRGSTNPTDVASEGLV